MERVWGGLWREHFRERCGKWQHEKRGSEEGLANRFERGVTRVVEMGVLRVLGLCITGI